MKMLLLTVSLATAGVGTSQAEIYRPSIVGQSTVLGAVAGALIGGHNDDRWVQGAVIGAAAGAIIGSAVDHSRPVVYQEREIRPVYSRAPMVVTHAPRVVYVEPSPRVVYVESYSRPVIVTRPVVYISNHRSHGHYRGRDHRHGGHRRDRHDHRRW